MRRTFAFIFRPSGKGLHTVLGTLEAAVMEVVWTEQDVSVRDVHRRLERRRRIAYTTVMTTLARLARKGLLTRRMAAGAYRYAPAVTREQLEGAVADSVIGKLLEGFGKTAVSRLLDRLQHEDPRQIERLARLIEERRRRKK